MAKEELALVSKKYRAEILRILIETPLHFSELLRRLKPMSSRTLSKHLKSLENEGLISTRIEGRKIVFEAIKPKTILQLRKEYLQQLISLLHAYESALNQKTAIITQDYLNALKESITKPEEEAERTKVLRKTIELKKGFKTIVPISDFYGKTEFKKVESVECEKCGQSHSLIEDMNGFYYVCPRDNKVRRVGDWRVNRDLTISPLKFRRNRKRKVKKPSRLR